MSPQSALDLVTLLGLAAVSYLLLSLRSYVNAKCENQATKEDFGVITDEVERIKHQYTTQVESMAQQIRLVVEAVRQQHDLRLAAVDRRLIAHQEAYSLWWSLMRSLHDKTKVGGAVNECQEWLVRNRLFLEAEVADAFAEAFQAAFLHRNLVYANSSRTEVQESWATIRSVGSIIVAAVKLPGLSTGEYAPVTSDEQQDAENPRA